MLRGCPHCGANLTASLGGFISPFCEACGEVLPWANRGARIHELENRLRREPMDEATALVLREQLAALQSPDLSEKEQRKRWERVRAIAPKIWLEVAPLLRSLLSAELQAKLGIPAG